MIGGLGLRPDGVVYVVDDPALLDPAEPMGTGRMFHIGLPAAHIPAGRSTTRAAEPPTAASPPTRRRPSPSRATASNSSAASPARA